MYDSIYTCPIIIFQKVIETGDYSLTGTKGNFDKMNSEIIDEFGLTEINQVIFHKTKQLIKLQAKKIYTEDEKLDIHIEIAEKQLQSLLNKCAKEENIRQLHARNHRIISKWSGRKSTELTVFEYYNDLRDYEKEVNNAGKNRQRYHTDTGYDRSNPKGI